MLASLKQFFSNSKSEQTSISEEHALKLAAATLMFEVSRSDGEIAADELKVMGQVLKRDFELSDEEVEELTSDAKQASEDAISLQGFTRQICDRWGNQERRSLVEACWMIALVDSNLDAHERHTVRKIAGLLYLTDHEIIVAKEAAAKRLK
ncbi:MAG: TerB family tellurite resistance protein [Arenicella sp.]|jgi:uncharacterized tellurite resistance protein B-like protein|nr:TerB family tellurite resistance protein [Arenicella sp.]HAU67442.1 hypothetical protein [Gammaproteobacteria bacterium]